MLALSLGLIVIAGVAQVFVGGRQSYASLQNQSRLQESGRYALAFIGQSARSAGYLGCAGRRGRILNTLNGEIDSLFALNITRSVDAFDSSGGGSVADFAKRAGINSANILPGTDLIAFRRVAGPLLRVASPVGAHGNPVVEKRDASILKANDFALIGNCAQVSLFRITGLVNGADHVTLLRDHGEDALENSATKPLYDLGDGYGPASESGAAQVGPVVTEVYFIARGISGGGRGNPIHSLWRRSGLTAPAELVEGINDLQLTFGVDTLPHDGEASVNRVVGYNAIASDAIVRTVHVRVVVDDPVRPRSFSQTFNLRNAGYEQRQPPGRELARSAAG